VKYRLSHPTEVKLKVLI